MNAAAKNKLLVWLVALLVVANAASIAMFWLGKKNQPAPPKGTPNEFLIKELKLDAKQQEQLTALIKEHQQKAIFIRNRIKEAKKQFFDLLKQPDITDSAKKSASAIANFLTQELDVMTFDHFQKVRAICTPEQQKRFDEIINEVTSMMGQPRPPMGPGNGPPPGGPGGDRPAPPGQ